MLGCRRHLLWSQDFSSVSGALAMSPTHIPIAVHPTPGLQQLSSHPGTLCFLFDTLPLLLLLLVAAQPSPRRPRFQVS